MLKLRQQVGGLGNILFKEAYILGQMYDGKVPDVYVQSIKYWEEHRAKIKERFSWDITPIDMVAIHVRRGDYVKNPFYVDLMETEYYQNAMLEFVDEQFLVFSDDIEWCKKQKIFQGCEFSEGRTEVEDLNLMAGCKGIIMANSSFSWWAAFLSKAKVIAPLAWHPDCVERTELLPEWKKL